MFKIKTSYVVSALIVLIAATTLHTYSNKQASLNPEDIWRLAHIATADAAAVDYFLKIDGVEGESTDGSHVGSIDLSSFSWSKPGAGIKMQPGGGGGGGAGKASFFDVFFESNVSKASPKLMLNSATGKHIPKAVLSVRKAGGNQEDFLVITFTDVLVTSYQAAGKSGQVPTDQFSLNFAKIKMEYKQTRPNGRLGPPFVAEWDLRESRAITEPTDAEALPQETPVPESNELVPTETSPAIN